MNEKNISTITKNIAQRIDMLRTQADLSFRELAKISGISKSEISNIVLLKTSPSVDTLNRICRALNVSLVDLLSPNENIIILKRKENVLISIFRELSPMSQDTLIKVSKCMK